MNASVRGTSVNDGGLLTVLSSSVFIDAGGYSLATDVLSPFRSSIGMSGSISSSGERMFDVEFKLTRFFGNIISATFACQPDVEFAVMPVEREEETSVDARGVFIDLWGPTKELDEEDLPRTREYWSV